MRSLWLTVTGRSGPSTQASRCPDLLLETWCFLSVTGGGFPTGIGGGFEAGMGGGIRPQYARRTAKMLIGELGISKFDRDRIQNHAISDVSGQHYDRYEYLDEKRKGSDIWCARLEHTTKY